MWKTGDTDPAHPKVPQRAAAITQRAGTKKAPACYGALLRLYPIGLPHPATGFTVTSESLALPAKRGNTSYAPQISSIWNSPSGLIIAAFQSVEHFERALSLSC